MGDPGVFDRTSDIEETMAAGARFMTDLSRAMVVLSCAVGDQLGLFAALADGQGRSADDIAKQAGADARYVREWARTLAAAGYLELDRSGEEFRLPPAYAALLADPGSPYYVGGIARLVPPLAAMVERVAGCFHSGEGLTPGDYPPAMYQATWRMSAKWLEAMLLDQWLPLVPGLEEKLTAGAEVAHLACGSGTALALLARRFPASRCTGVDRHELNVERARGEIAEYGVADRVTLTQVTGFADGLSGPYELVMAFDSLHLAADPGDVLRDVARALTETGVFLLLETDCSTDPHENVGDVAAFLYGTSTLYSVPLSRTGPVVAGMLGLPQPVLTRLCADAGLTAPRRIAAPTPFNVLYEIRKAS
ncbi:class I SAM-dependent methyltransferase [Nonomuraea ferruginea]|uniref:Class I SAM-dependent methyltransferase n=1 Tax=Nonomuraea ferruginea TaxID=46174 RepID=A0ABT4T331_9ACTN|nr:class I SAM-dependent methyltransferase [Nonomuraea ferruginea]MDA0643810.1 class I SAM-dependent methyltransferase [Nonomuraea ferruginea]